jgi:hypothetical protein
MGTDLPKGEESGLAVAAVCRLSRRMIAHAQLPKDYLVAFLKRGSEADANP